MDNLNFTNQLIDIKEYLFKYALKLTSNIDNADDLLHDTFYKAITHKDNFKEGTSIRAWATTIMKHIFINNYRRDVIKNNIISNTEQLMYLIYKKDNNPTPDSYSNFKYINDIVNNLDVRLRIPFRMHTEGYSYNDISRKLKLKLGTVKSRIFTARQELMNKISNIN